jgi:hypothetical protein
MTKRQLIFYEALYRALMMLASAIKKAYLDGNPELDEDLKS